MTQPNDLHYHTNRDLEFAAQLEGVTPGVIALVCVLSEWQRQRIEFLHDLLAECATATTEVESRCVELAEQVRRLEAQVRQPQHERAGAML